MFGGPVAGKPGPYRQARRRVGVRLGGNEAAGYQRFLAIR